jgi:hypothetical protein
MMRCEMEMVSPKGEGLAVMQHTALFGIHSQGNRREVRVF